MFQTIFPKVCKPCGGARKTVKRFFLSNAYKCQEAWEKRLENPAFKKVNLENLYHDLESAFTKKQKISILDIDLFINGVDSYYKNELEDVLLRLRECPECGIFPERANYAAIRWYLSHGNTNDLLNVLSDRLNYGLFPDHHINNMLMDRYLKERDVKSAVKIAVLQMLQEDFSNEITKPLALHCCYKYLDSDEIWTSYKEPEPDPDEEVVKVRVSYVRNPYFDDHFDIKDTNHLVGKTMWMVGKCLGGQVGTSSQVLGLVLYEKYEKLIELLEEMVKSNKRINEEAAKKAEEFCMMKPKQSNSEQDEGKSELTEVKKNVITLLKKIKTEESGSLLAETAKLTEEAVRKHEGNYIQQQVQVFKQWEKDRADLIRTEIEKAELEKVKAEIQSTKENLAKSEETLFFFDKEEELTLLAEEKEEEKKAVKFYTAKGKHKEKVVEDYVPPDVKKNY